MSRAARLARYSEVSSSLAVLSDRKLGRLVDDAGSAGSGIGGTSAVADVAGLPVYCQYGVGSPGPAPEPRRVLRPDQLVNWLVSNVCGVADPAAPVWWALSSWPAWRRALLLSPPRA